jgi:glycosyltransferase-like protein
MRRRIGILTHSVNPRGGVVHAMQLAEALCDMGQEATLIAPATPGQAFFRRPRCPHTLIPARPEKGTVAMASRRIYEIAAFMEGQNFDILHAQDAINGNALADLQMCGAIRGFARTVHHLEHFADPLLAEWQDRALHAAERVFCVSSFWRRRIADRTNRVPVMVGNGVDGARYTPVPCPGDLAVKRRLALPDGPIFLVLGGIEKRKNTPAILRAFLRLHADYPLARLVVAGGATLLDHDTARAAFAEALAEAAPEARAAVQFIGVIEDADMPALYRLSHALVSPSLMEGFGLCAIEAMSCGRPTILSDIAPFNEHVAPNESLWADPRFETSIKDAMRAALQPVVAEKLTRSGPRVAARFTWRDVALAHLPIYAAMAEGPLAHA